MILGIDFGGTKLEYRLFDENLREIDSSRYIIKLLSYSQLIDLMVNIFTQIQNKHGFIQFIGIACPGKVDDDTNISYNAPSSVINLKSFKTNISNAINRTVAIINDASSFSLSEACGGSGDEYSTVFGVILGTGVGGGFVVDKKLIRGRNGIAGEWGHNPFPLFHASSKEYDQPNLPSCSCGAVNHIESWLSGPSFERIYFEIKGEALNAIDIVNKLRSGDAAAVRAFSIYSDRLAQALSSVINVLDPDVIVLGGGLSNTKEIYDIIPNIWGKYIFSNNIKTKLLPPMHGDASGARGAAIFCLSQTS